MREFSVPGTDAQSNGLKSYMRDGILSARNDIRNYSAQLSTKYRLMNELSHAFGGPVDESLVGERQSDDNTLVPDRLAGIIVHLVPWYNTIQDIEKELSKTSSPITEDKVFASPLPPNLSAKQMKICKSLQLIMSAHAKLQKAKVLQAQSNMELLAYMMLWHSTVRTFM